MKCVILQPSYIPWRGYFHQIAKADVFVFYDDVQYDKRGWRNRNRIKTPHGSQWLTIPVHSKGAQTHHILINEIPICWDNNWNKDHYLTLESVYAKAPFFERYKPLLQDFYAREPELLADFTIETTQALAHALGIQGTEFLRASSLDVEGSKTDRLIHILSRLGADHYISGPSARDYIEAQKFEAAGITLEYMHYDYPEYPQLYPPFDPQVSILDLMFMTGPQALDYILESNKT
jgi:hypothetical protein